MALIKCPECGKEISDKANSCPNCGYPIKELKEEEARKNNSFVLFGKWYINSHNQKEDIPWIVLKEDQNELLLLSLYGLRFMPYSDCGVNTNWEMCSLRKWLNDIFCKEAFDTIELTRMLAIKRDNPRTAKTFFDNVSLLSIGDAKLIKQDCIKCQPSYYSNEVARKEYYFNGENFYNNGWWLLEAGFTEQTSWVIDPNRSPYTAAYNEHGVLFPDVLNGDVHNLVRPIIRIKNIDIVRKDKMTEKKNDSNEDKTLVKAKELVKNLLSKFSDDTVDQIINDCIVLSVKFDENKFESKFELINNLLKLLNVDGDSYDDVTFKTKCSWESKEELIQTLSEYPTEANKYFYELILLACSYRGELSDEERRGLADISFMNN